MPQQEIDIIQEFYGDLREIVGEIISLRETEKDLRDELDDRAKYIVSLEGEVAEKSEEIDELQDRLNEYEDA